MASGFFAVFRRKMRQTQFMMKKFLFPLDVYKRQPLQGAVKQSIQGTFFSLLRLGRGLIGLTWWTSVWLAPVSYTHLPCV